MYVYVWFPLNIHVYICIYIYTQTCMFANALCLYACTHMYVCGSLSLYIYISSDYRRRRNNATELGKQRKDNSRTIISEFDRQHTNTS